jgi:hypothetical protein
MASIRPIHAPGMSALKQIRIAVGIVIFGLVASGVTAFPLLQELNVLAALVAGGPHSSPVLPAGLTRWILTVRDGLEATYASYPFIAYGTDWLAFAHLTIALFFILPWRDPARYAGVLKAGIAASLAVVPLALICGHLREIPIGWRLIDCSFGILCLPPLCFALGRIRALPAYPRVETTPGESASRFPADEIGAQARTFSQSSTCAR